ncbi:MAG TPA: YfiR/HmsC family protein, partial [Burkholderiales bacterium]|nr:YfiR/HmsC family protein [Burkholderiales bacterium]
MNPTRILSIVSLLFVGVLIALLHSSARAAQPEEAAADRIRAAYILKFLEYVEWPEALFSDAAAPFVIGVNGAEYIANELARLAPTRTSG